MPDEANGMGELWRSQPAEDVQISPDELRRKARRFESKIRRGYRISIALLTFLASGYGSFLYFFPGVMQRLGSVLALGGFCFAAYELYRRGPARKVPGGPPALTIAAY